MSKQSCTYFTDSQRTERDDAAGHENEALYLAPEKVLPEDQNVWQHKLDRRANRGIMPAPYADA